MRQISLLLPISVLTVTACTVGDFRPTWDGGPRPDVTLIPTPDESLESEANGACEVGFIDCFGECTRVAWDEHNCGSCGNECGAGVGCSNGKCACFAPMLSCRGVCIDPSSDPMNCGTCENACGPSGMCLDGSCIVMCDEPSVICYDGETPTCADLQTDPMNCGSCSSRCTGGGVCRDGRCQCPAGYLNCGGHCADIENDPSNCGSCGLSCGTGGSCSNARCTCGSDRTECSGRCIDTLTDRYNCGTCGRACGAGETCTGGVCGCTAPRMMCGGTCIDPLTDRTHCGGCATDCGSSGICSGGECTCSSGLTMCGGACRNLATDLTNCGACGRVCPSLTGGVCAGGVCGCPAGAMNCGGVCRDVTSDRNNCGACGRSCPGNQVCYMSECTTTPPTRYVLASPTAEAVPWIDACSAPGHSEHLRMGDDSSERVTLPFAFRYWATDLPAGAPINITTNGWLGMDGVVSSALGGSMPSTSTPNAVIGPHWGDNYTRGPVCVATIGTAPNRQFVVQWNDTYYCCSDSGTVHNTYEVILSEGSNLIDFVYQTMTGARTQLMGLEDQSGSMAINACPGGATSCIPSAGQRVRFVPSL